MSFRFLDWFQAPSGEAPEDQNGGYVAPVKNTFIHFGELEQPDYRPARSGPAKVETAPEHFSGTLPRLQEEGGRSDSFAGDAVDAVESPGDVGDEGPSIPATTSMASACFEALTPVEAPIKNTFIHFDEQQPDYTTTVSGPAILRSSPPKTHVESEAVPGPSPPKTTVTEDPGPLPSVGSVGHANGTCKPCAHNWKDAGCSKGANCSFCHLCEAEDFHRRRKEKTQRLKAERSRKKGEKEELKTTEAAAPRPVGLLDTLEVHKPQAASQAQASQAMAPGELQLSCESDCVVVRWCVDLRRLCSQYRYGLSRRFVVRFTEEVPFVLFLNPAASAGAFSTAELRATMQVKCTDPCADMPHLQMLFGVDDQPAAVVEDHDFQVEPLCAAQGTTWQLGDTTAILRVELSVRP